MLEALLLLLGSAVSGGSFAGQIHDQVSSGQGSKLSAMLKSNIDDMLYHEAKKLASNKELAEKLYTIYQQKGADVARMYLMQSPFGSNVKILRRELQKTVDEFNQMNKSVTENRSKIETTVDTLQNHKNSLSGSKADALIVERNMREDWKNNKLSSGWHHEGSQINRYLDKLQNKNKFWDDSNKNNSATQNGATTAPTVQVQGGLPTNTPVIKNPIRPNKVSNSQVMK